MKVWKDFMNFFEDNYRYSMKIICKVNKVSKYVIFYNK